MTTYIVFKAEGANGCWQRVGTYEALGSDQAVRKAIDGRDEGGTFVAVPMRSFQPLTVEIEVKRSLKIGEATGQLPELDAALPPSDGDGAAEPAPEPEPEPAAADVPPTREPVPDGGRY